MSGYDPRALGAEEWREVEWAPDYEVSDRGRVRSFKGRPGLDMPHVMSQSKKYDSSGRWYWCVGITIDGRKTRTTVHKLVTAAFIGPRPDGLEVNHKDLDRSNNTPNNLEYCTHSENIKHAAGFGRMSREKASTTELRREIRALRAKGWKEQDLADRFGISQSYANSLIKGVSHPPIVPSCNKLSYEKAQEIRAARAAGVRPGVLAEKYGVSPSLITIVVAGKVWVSQ